MAKLFTFSRALVLLVAVAGELEQHRQDELTFFDNTLDKDALAFGSGLCRWIVVLCHIRTAELCKSSCLEDELVQPLRAESRAALEA